MLLSKQLKPAITQAPHSTLFIMKQYELYNVHSEKWKTYFMLKDYLYTTAEMRNFENMRFLIKYDM